MGGLVHRAVLLPCHSLDPLAKGHPLDDWARDRGVERRLLTAAAEVHGTAQEHVASLDRYADSRTLPGPVRFAGRSLITEAAEEIADLANYLRWEMVRAEIEGRSEWAEVISRVLADALQVWTSLEQAASLAEGLEVPFVSPSY